MIWTLIGYGFAIAAGMIFCSVVNDMIRDLKK